MLAEHPGSRPTGHLACSVIRDSQLVNGALPGESELAAGFCL